MKIDAQKKVKILNLRKIFMIKMNILQFRNITMLSQIISGTLLERGKIQKLTYSDDRLIKQKKIAEDAKNDTQDRQEVNTYLR